MEICNLFISWIDFQQLLLDPFCLQTLVVYYIGVAAKVRRYINDLVVCWLDLVSTSVHDAVGYYN
jgi:hypothetical protein